MKKIITGIIIVIFIGLSLIALNEGLKKHERVECQQWLKQSQEYPDFYWADWQLEQCRALRIID